MIPINILLTNANSIHLTFVPGLVTILRPLTLVENEFESDVTLNGNLFIF